MTSPSRRSASSDRGWGVHWLAAACVQAQISPGTWWTGPSSSSLCPARRDGRRQVAAASVEQQDRRHRLHRPRPSVQLPRCLAISASTLVGPNCEREAAAGAAAARRKEERCTKQRSSRCCSQRAERQENAEAEQHDAGTSAAEDGVSVLAQLVGVSSTCRRPVVVS